MIEEFRLASNIHPNQCLLFFRDPELEFNLERMKHVLADDGVEATGDVEPLALRCTDGPTLHASIIRGEAAAALAEQLTFQDHEFQTLAVASDTCIVIKFDSLEEVLKELNTLVQVQTTLQDATGCLLYCGWNQLFMGPDD